jgi:hypothetical protein
MNWFTAWLIGLAIAILLDFVIVSGLNITNLVVAFLIGVINGLIWPSLCIKLYAKENVQ